MTRVNINGGDLSYVIEKAQKLWQDTRPGDKPAGPAYGFSAEREHRRAGYARMDEGQQPAVRS